MKTNFNASHCRVCGEEHEGGMCDSCVRKDEIFNDKHCKYCGKETPKRGTYCSFRCMKRDRHNSGMKIFKIWYF